MNYFDKLNRKSNTLPGTSRDLEEAGDPLPLMWYKELRTVVCCTVV